MVYIGCGERGNEMTDVLNEFPELKDPKTGHSLMQRTVLIANTSDMPVAAREASIYTGKLPLQNTSRDMGYSVALMADSTSRWAEALREMSGRLEEMAPARKAIPLTWEAVWPSSTREPAMWCAMVRKAGRALFQPSEPYRRQEEISRSLCPRPPSALSRSSRGLDSSLAYKRHFPAINWLTSYSLYVDNMGKNRV